MKNNKGNKITQIDMLKDFIVFLVEDLKLYILWDEADFTYRVIQIQRTTNKALLNTLKGNLPKSIKKIKNDKFLFLNYHNDPIFTFEKKEIELYESLSFDIEGIKKDTILYNTNKSIFRTEKRFKEYLELLINMLYKKDEYTKVKRK